MAKCAMCTQPCWRFDRRPLRWVVRGCPRSHRWKSWPTSFPAALHRITLHWNVSPRRWSWYRTQPTPVCPRYRATPPHSRATTQSHPRWRRLHALGKMSRLRTHRNAPWIPLTHLRESKRHHEWIQIFLFVQIFLTLLYYIYWEIVILRELNPRSISVCVLSRYALTSAVFQVNNEPQQTQRQPHRYIIKVHDCFVHAKLGGGKNST